MNHGEKRSGMIHKVLNDMGIGIALLVLIVVLSLASPYFFTMNNIINILLQSAISIVIATGMTFVILTGGIDLSIGSVVALCGMVYAMLAKEQNNLALCVAVCMAIGIFIGLFNGIVISTLKIPAFIATLGMMNIGRGLTLLIINGQSIVGLKAKYRFLGNSYLGKVPVITLIAIGILLIGWHTLRNTKFGRYVYAIGGNKEATRLSGINIQRFETIVYIISGGLCAVAAMMLVGRLNVADANAGSGYEMDAIAATIIGGTSMSGGKGNIFGTFMGAFFMVILKNGLNLLGVSSYIQTIVIGFVVIFAVFLDISRARIAQKA